ncbi:hypothetical protein V8F33_004827 [Rhypophila sp. PSN 637]
MGWTDMGNASGSLDTADLDGTLVPPWYYEAPPRLTDMFLATFIWGFTIAIAAYSCTKAVQQTYRSWTRSHRLNAYIVMVWLEWISCLATTATSWLFLENFINPSVWYFTGMLCMWTIQIQCLMQIMTNRIALIMYNPDRAVKLKWAVGIAIGIINVTVFCIWVPARLQISPTYIRANQIWDRAEKCIFLIIDGFLNGYFMYLIRTKLIANGLEKYKLVYRFNLVMVIFSLSLDVMVIGLMSLPDDDVYVQLHPAAYLIKLHIEMNIAELLGKVLRMSTHRRNSLAAHSHSYANSRLGGACPPIMSNVNRPWQNSVDGRGGRQRRLLSLETALLDDDDLLSDCWCDGGGLHMESPNQDRQTTGHDNITSMNGIIESPHPSPRTTTGGDGDQSAGANEAQQQQHVEIPPQPRPTRPAPVHRKDSTWSGTGTMSSYITEPMDYWSDSQTPSKESVVTL